jgi:hypothetical protein
MKRRYFLTAAIIVLGLLGKLQASKPVLHPDGFGEHSYCSWKAQEGLPDSLGMENQALYLQKMTSTGSFGAGLGIIDVQGVRASELTGLSFDVGTDGQCGLTAPRFDVRIKHDDTGAVESFSFGCATMAPGATQTAPNGRVFQRRTKVIGNGDLPSGTIVSLALVFDVGDDAGVGFVFLDNITINTTSAIVGVEVWTSASDNAADSSYW